MSADRSLAATRGVDASLPGELSSRLTSPVHVIRSDEEALATVRALAAEFRAGAAERDRTGRLPADEIEQLTTAGFYGITVPAQFGGANVSAVTVAEAFRILAAADASIGQIPQNHFCWLPVVSNGSPEQAEFFYRRFLAGERIGNAHSEDTRRRPGDYEHVLERVAGGWRVTGRKYYSTGAVFAQWIPFVANLGDGAKPHMFFVPRGQDGVEIVNDWDGMGQRTTASGTTIFDRAFVADEHVFALRAESDSARSYALNASLIHAAIDVGIAEDVLGDARDYIVTANRPWINNPHDEHAKEPFVIRDFGRFGVAVRTAHVSLLNAARLIDRARAEPGQQTLLDARMAIADARIVASEAATKVADEFFLLTGARATRARYGLDRHWRNARTHSLHDPLRWKEFHLGNFYLNGIEPPPGSYI
ncbi:SfnB family sulfur acquisition oxidoreductase [Bradyrhizobium sp. U87765 SZCCT0131]|uniref:SfnB family sulfur acquisition oxidoreductase n=1 Tax=unclassified Bradyrhizobium TaxID=2631580 RepID=UPI001BA67E08|nr:MULTISPECIES: SfnB family sulfur acquisition oxidoreductase [unclassified Bradyrhizobium]MBR1222995.1 SfnB family sulfur acquisition oxidoreductase [Bradyrhizobium sp. U87765 SZCCT0131]MBR1262731.1 SfnB family sulfur acquisition oxidoreductase [Bradyrhizobium sp. U87765 SZCCT0134]MBR1308797.1 SfnB family sulfur acquisition oxidoreductase [Bradyrhizobium sp. U87765 SZCCT0110]MBR1318513.1 SfnB family sulfur acquisition oxidoreductase [Bradyrhizobium sp. U87765 SZCCT0109]MBR1352217.1 SfnB fami